VRLLAAAACCAALAAHATDPALLGRDMAIDPQKELAETRLFEDVVVAPIPISPLSDTAVAACYTSSGSWRIGAVVFASSGKVAPSFGDMGEQPDLPIADGRDGTAAYVYVKEAF